ncbi:unnamed protein product [Lota lota]
MQCVTNIPRRTLTSWKNGQNIKPRYDADRHKPFQAKLGLRHHLSLIRKLLDASYAVEIGASDKAFIHRCLQGYL